MSVLLKQGGLCLHEVNGAISGDISGYTNWRESLDAAVIQEFNHFFQYVFIIKFLFKFRVFLCKFID